MKSWEVIHRCKKKRFCVIELAGDCETCKAKGPRATVEPWSDDEDDYSEKTAGSWYRYSSDVER